MDIKFLISTTENTHSRCDIIKSCWGKNQDVLFFTDTERKNRPEFIKVSDDKTWNSNIEKLTNALVYAYKNTTSDWYFLGCDDRYIFVDNLEEFLKDKNPKIPVCYGKIAKIPDFPEGYLNGAGNLCSRAALEIIVYQIENHPVFRPVPAEYNHHAADLYIGHLCRDSYAVEMGLEMIHCDLFHDHQPTLVGTDGSLHTLPLDSLPDATVENDALRKYIGFHYIKSPQDFNSMVMIESGQTHHLVPTPSIGTDI